MLGIFFLPSCPRLTWKPCFVFPVAISEQFCLEDCAQVMTTNPKPNKALKVGKKLSGWCWVAGEALHSICPAVSGKTKGWCLKSSVFSVIEGLFQLKLFCECENNGGGKCA